MLGVSGEVSEVGDGANWVMVGRDWLLHVVASFNIVCRMYAMYSSGPTIPYIPFLVDGSILAAGDRPQEI